ncbi:carboxypeptidase regulatory-like domain-containing protein [Silvibacterium sp.]|uniref:carboxypeptidase regulatory-like domain-containing protein n=1 Tax=Silvibacterium sp. TaxID=1964179 RepID=UPI0039E3C870
MKLHNLSNIVFAFLVAGGSAICPALGYGQSAQGTILGHVTDPSGAMVPGATVTLTNEDTHLTQTTKSSGVGDYVFVNITPGTYDVSVERDGFQTSEATGLILNVDATLRQNFAMAVGSQAQQVTVSSDMQMLQTDNASLGTVVGSKLISDLPIIGRDFTNLLKLQAGVTQVQGSSQLYWAQHGLNTDFNSVSVNGARTESVSYLVDGIMDNDQFFSTANNIPTSDSIAEFKVQNGMYGAEYGQGSAQINVAIKSGTLQYHGTAYDYMQNSAFQPHNPYYKYENEVLGEDVSEAKDRLVQNQYGFSLGGPVWIPKIYSKGKTFFFYGYEAGRKRQGTQSSGLVPTTAERSGDFSDWRDSSGNLIPIYDPSTEVNDDPSTRKAFANNQITSALSPIAKNMLALYPTPNVTQPNIAGCAKGGGCVNYIASLEKPLDTDNSTFRIDHNLSDRDQLYFSAILGDQKYVSPSLMPLSGSITSQNNHLLAFNWQRAITPTMFNQFRVGYNQQYWIDGLNSEQVNYGQQLGFANTPSDPNLWALPILTLSGYEGLGNGNGNWHQKENIYQVVDNLKYIHGRHTITLGLDIRRIMLDMTAGYSADGSLGFNGAYSGTNPTTSEASIGVAGSGNAVADLLMGNPTSISGPTPGGSDLFNVRATNWNFFAQDDVRVTPNLTMNFGLRYEIPPSFHSVNNSGLVLDTSNGGSFDWASKANQATVSAISGVNPYLTGYSSNNKLIQNNFTNFSPRIGFAWRPTNLPRMDVRGGYGLFYDLQNQWYSLTSYDDISTYYGSFAYPTSTGYTAAAPTKLDDLWTAGSDASYFQEPYWEAGPQVNWPKNRSPYNQQWSLGTQYAITETLLLDVTYVGAHAVHQPGYWYYNAGRMTGVDDACNTNRSVEEAEESNPSCLTDPNFVPVLDRANFSHIRSNAYAIANIFSSSYNALQVRLDKRYSQGLDLQTNYTYSRALDEVSAINNIVGSTLTAQNNNCISCEWGPAAFDQTQRLVSSGSYELPVGKGKKYSTGRIGNYILGNWELSGIFTVASGNPFTLNNTSDSSLGQDGVRGDLRRPNQVGNPHDAVYGELDTTKYPVAQFKNKIYHWFNPAAYEAGAGNTYGDVRRNSLRGPFFMRGDMTFMKNIPIHDEHVLTYRLEIYNMFSPWHGQTSLAPSSTLNSGNFSSLVTLQTNSAGQYLQEAQQSGMLQNWSSYVRTMQMSLKYRF